HALAGYGYKMAGKSKEGDELLRKARVYRDIQAQKMSNFLDPYATFDAFKEVIKRWFEPSIHEPQKKNTHLALDDIRESIEELKWYKEKYFIK
ncbi:MAG: hypothetical protein P8K05_04660, partial [Dehalococcoidia bacterium]|nr:hypothetical protein [Dehalococcoidia bacterium]